MITLIRDLDAKRHEKTCIRHVSVTNNHSHPTILGPTPTYPPPLVLTDEEDTLTLSRTGHGNVAATGGARKLRRSACHVWSSQQHA
jgi:hypothetical protein